jgi:hypothetical protein
VNLKEAVSWAGITDAHIVDDAFDAVPGAGLQDAAIHTFFSDIDEPQLDAIAALLGAPGAGEDEVLARLRTQEGAAALYEQRALYGAPADLLFENFANVAGPERNRLKPLIDFLEGLGIKCHKFGRDYVLDGEPEPQVLFVDLKLNEDRIILEEPIKVVHKMRKSYPDAHPLVFLMSSQEGSLKAERESFRKRCDLFTSQFEDLTKRTIAKALALERFFEHHVRVYPSIVALQRQVGSWSQAMVMAQKKLETALRQLDFADYFVLRNTASADGLKLGGYVTDLLLEYVAHHIEASPSIGDFAKELDTWDLRELTRSRFNIDPLVADIFAANVLHAPERLKWERERGLGPANGLLCLGDVFFVREEIDSGAIKSAAVVLQPACDLVRPSSIVDRKATILLCKGTVKPLSGASDLATVDNLDPVILRYPPTSDVQYVIEWQKKQPFFWPHSELERLKTPAAHEWVHVGRLRPLYALQLQRAVTADLSRVGTQRRPTTYVPHGVEVLVPKNGRWITLLTHADDPSAAAISDDKREKRKTFILSDPVIRETFEKLQSWIEGNAGQGASAALTRLLASPEAVRALMFHVASTAPEARKDFVCPLRVAALPAGLGEVLGASVVFATQREEDKKFAPGKDVGADERAIMVFRFVRIVR